MPVTTMERSDSTMSSKASKAPAGSGRVNPLDAPKRRKPKQERSKTTVDEILKAAVEILVESRFESLTMLNIANKAGISIATAYSYFPNKHHVLAHLARTQLDQRLGLLEGEFALLKTRADWIDGYCQTLVDLARLRGDQPGSMALRQAMHASPSLWEIDQEGNERAARLVSNLLRTVAGEDPNRDVQGRLIAEIVTAALDHMQSVDQAESEAILYEMTGLVRAYLERIATRRV